MESGFRLLDTSTPLAVGDADLLLIDASPPHLADLGIVLTIPDEPPMWSDAGPTAGAAIELVNGNRYVLMRGVDPDGLPMRSLAGNVVVVGRSGSDLEFQIAELLQVLRLGPDAVLWRNDDIDENVQIVRMVTWNVARRVRRVDEQALALRRLTPDIVALQEVMPSAEDAWRRALADAGLPHVATSRSLALDPDELVGPRSFGVLIASRFPLAPLAPLSDAPWPERILRATIHVPFGELEVSAVHVPIGSRHGWIKIETFEAIHAALAAEPARLRVLCGDLNAPRAEQPDGTVITWAQTMRGRLIRSRGERWDAGERSILTGLAEHGMRDVVRATHGNDVSLDSWNPRRHGKRYPYRFDHLFADTRLLPCRAAYLTDIREGGLSDHAPLVVDLRRLRGA